MASVRIRLEDVPVAVMTCTVGELRQPSTVSLLLGHFHHVA
ncbi:hypothetical protein [Kribbella ginsengisoli]